MSSIGNIVYALSGGFAQLVIGLFIIAMGTTMFFTAYRTIMQKLTPLSLQGQISGTLDVFPKGLAMASVAVSSFLLTLWSIKTIVLVANWPMRARGAHEITAITSR